MTPRQMMKFSIASVLAAASAQALAGEVAAPPDTSEWTCSACPFDKGYQGEVNAGVIYATGANAASGRYTGIDREGADLDAGARGAYVKDDGSFATYALNDLGLDSRSGAIKFGRYGHFDVALTYDGQPNRRYDTTATPFSGGAVQTLPDGSKVNKGASHHAVLRDSAGRVRVEQACVVVHRVAREHGLAGQVGGIARC